MSAPGVYGRILQNTVFLVSGRLLSRIMQFFLFIYAARQLGVHAFGIFSFGYATVSMLAIAMDLGLSTYLVQVVSRKPESTRAYMARSLLAKAVLIGPAFLLILLVGFFAQRDAQTLLVLSILGFGTIFDSLTVVFYSAFEAHEKMAYPAVVIAVSNFFMSLLGILLLYFRQDLLLLCVVYSAGALLRLGFAGTWCIRHFGRPHWRALQPSIFELLRLSLPFALVSIFVSIYYYIDTVILSLFCSEEIVGQYNAAYRLLEAPLFVIQAVTTALFPAAAKIYAADPSELKPVMSQLIEKACGFGLSVAVVTAILSGKLIELVYGTTYGPAGPLLAVLIFSAAVIMPSTVCGTVLRAIGRQTVSAWVTGLGALLNILINFVLIPFWGAMGAAWATLITEGFVLVVYFTLIFRLIGAVGRWQTLVRAVFLTGLWSLTLFLTRSWHVLFQILLCTALFFPFLSVAGILTVEEVRRLILKARAT